jgi:pyruvate,water dikinase
MKNNIIKLAEIDDYKNFLGNKTLNLKKCATWGYNVPRFVALPSYVSKDLFEKEDFRGEIVEEIIDILPNCKYAVRSSALIEDSDNQSWAGQFLTKVNLSGSELNRGIYEVLAQAKTFLHGDLDNFSLIVQEYITADIAGVTFTRNHNGGREMVLEYGFCAGEKIVSGEIKPIGLSFYWHDQDSINLPEVFLANQIIEKFKEIENKYNFPQDIEWCLKDRQFYLLQTRSITTISKKHYEEIKFLEDFLVAKKKYYFAKTEISEIAPRPSNITCDLLHFIYSKNGPIDKVYKKYRVNYNNTGFLKIIGNELYIDKEKEIKALLPAYSYLEGKNFSPKICNFSKIIPTIKNIFFLNKIKTGNYEKIFFDLKAKIEAPSESNSDVKTALGNFLDDYKLIFEINLLAGLAIKKVDLLLRRESVNFIEILNDYSYFVDLNKYHIDHPENLVGNSLELFDEVNFSANNEIFENQANKKVIDWWQKIPEYKKKLVQDKIKEAVIYNRFREFGRWLAVKKINLLRKSLLDYANLCNLREVKNIFFSNFSSVLNNEIDEALILENFNNYWKYNHLCLPVDITSSLVIRDLKTMGVSAGVARGILCDQEFIAEKKGGLEKLILYTETLAPDLTKYFHKIAGIVSNNGGILSHLAIMARENNIPVVVGFSLNDSKFKLGDFMEIDGASGKVLKM